MTMSQDGWDSLETSTAEHMGSVGVLAAHLARGQNHTVVEGDHVRTAHATLGARPRATVSVFVTSTFGGLLGGVGGGMLGSIYLDASSAPTVTDPSFIAACILSVVGLILVVISVAITIVSRRR